MKYNNNEKNIVKSIICLLAIIELFRTIATYIMANRYESYIHNITHALIVFIVLSSIWLGKEKFFSFILKNMPSTKNEDIPTEDWVINIKFKDMENEKQRTGTVKIINTISGVRLVGDELTDFNNHTVTMNNWYSEYADVIKFDNHSVLYYIYKIPDNDGKYKKIGFVYAVKSKDGKIYNGYFQDMKVHDSQSAVENNRKGIVQIKMK